MFEKLPTEIICTILEYVVEPREEKPAANDDGDGPKVGNSLQYWYLDLDRSLLRLVCRSWNQTILAMAREINVTLGSDESMNALLQSPNRYEIIQYAIQGQHERRRLTRQLSIPIQGFYAPTAKRNNATKSYSVASSSKHAEPKKNPWTCPPFISSLSIQGNIPRSSDPKEDIVMSASYSGVQPRPGGVTGGSLCMGFQHLSNLTSLTICSDIMFTDESFLIALGSLAHLHQLVYTFPCDPVQPAWRDLFRYCSSCELYHRRVTTKTYLRELLMPELPQQIQEFTFEMDEPKFQHIRVDTIDQNHHGIDRAENTKFSLSLWKADATKAKNSSSATDQMEEWCGFELSQSEPRSWWPENLTRLDLSKSIITDSCFDVPPKLKELVISYPLEPNEIVVNGAADVLEEDKQWFPDSLTVLEVHGVPYHASCEMQDNPQAKAAAWMTYTNKILKMVPHQLEHFTINSFQVPDTESMTAMRYRVQNTLKTWKVRLLCPQKPKQSGFSPLQLYAPIIFTDDYSDEEEMEYSAQSSDYYGFDSDADMDSNTSFDSDLENANETPAQASYSAHINTGRAALRQYVETGATDQYDVTPIMLRNATRGMKALEKLEVEVNYQHYRFCSAIWKDNLGLSDPTGSTGTAPGLGTMEDMNSVDNVPHDQVSIGNEGESEDESDNEDLLREQMAGRGSRSSLATVSLVDRVDRKGKGRAADFDVPNLSVTSASTSDVKGKGKKIDEGGDRPNVGLIENEGDNGQETLFSHDGITKLDLMGHNRRIVRRPKTEILYWNNSCCGKRCLGWIRNQHN
ncbi:hypothetical protein BGZ65_004199 [Modicella reniformis]|uniref:F-box domain-containing protein n=1 Tax=Modicella reniformis TaxID=1440133 RepID=A0A9P6M8Z3_9FUNG|nr:hypothetical protein BGZ65_004199 [Modicella reniformis]